MGSEPLESYQKADQVDLIRTSMILNEYSPTPKGSGPPESDVLWPQFDHSQEVRTHLQDPVVVVVVAVVVLGLVCTAMSRLRWYFLHFGAALAVAAADVELSFAHEVATVDLELDSNKTGCIITKESFQLTCQAPGSGKASLPGEIPKFMKLLGPVQNVVLLFCFVHF